RWPPLRLPPEPTERFDVRPRSALVFRHEDFPFVAGPCRVTQTTSVPRLWHGRSFRRVCCRPRTIRAGSHTYGEPPPVFQQTAQAAPRRGLRAPQAASRRLERTAIPRRSAPVAWCVSCSICSLIFARPERLGKTSEPLSRIRGRVTGRALGA